MTLSELFPASLIAAIFFLMGYCVFYVATVPDPINRDQHVIELDCGDYERVLWVPVDTIGIAYREDGEKVNGVPNCIQTTIGKVGDIGKLPEVYNK